jgi:hypothetical protein
METNPNYPAFPSHGTMGEVVTPGLSIRAEIASRCLAGLLADPERNSPASSYAKDAVQLADALIAELNATAEG